MIWVERMDKKKCYLLLKTKFDHLVEGGHCYRIIYKDGDKIKTGVVYDGMHTRYGVSVQGTLKGKKITGLWQAHTGALSESEIILMLSFAINGCLDEDDFKEFSFSQLKGVRD